MAFRSAVDFHQVIQLCCVCLRSSRYTWRSAAAVVYYPNCIIALCLRGYNVSRCICHGAPRPLLLLLPLSPLPPPSVYGRSNGLIALSTQLRNCLQFTINPAGFSRARFSPINFTNAYAPSFFELFAAVHKSVGAINAY